MCTCVCVHVCVRVCTRWHACVARVWQPRADTPLVAAAAPCAPHVQGDESMYKGLLENLKIKVDAVSGARGCAWLCVAVRGCAWRRPVWCWRPCPQIACGAGLTSALAPLPLPSRPVPAPNLHAPAPRGAVPYTHARAYITTWRSPYTFTP